MRDITCASCGRKRPVHARGMCKSCYGRWLEEKNRKKRLVYKRAYYRKHREKWTIYNRLRMERHGEERRAYLARYRKQHREEISAYQRRYYQEHRSEKLARRRIRYEKNRDKELARNYCWAQKNPGKRAAIKARYKARKSRMPATLTPEQTEHLLRVGAATYPGERLHLDHVVPLSKGGGTTFANMQAIPASMNQAKHSKLPEEAYKQEELW